MEKYTIMLSQPNCVGAMATAQIERALKDKSLFFFGELLGKPVDDFLFNISFSFFFLSFFIFSFSVSLFF
jgi:hypothetical protein